MGAIAEVPVRFRLHALLEERAEAGVPMSQSEPSRRTGLSLTTVNQIVNNKTAQVSLATLDALCAALGVAPGKLLEPEKRKRGRA